MKKYIIAIIVVICCVLGVLYFIKHDSNNIEEPIETTPIIEEIIEEEPLENIITEEEIVEEPEVIIPEVSEPEPEIEEPEPEKPELEESELEEPEIIIQEPSEIISVTGENREQIALMIARVLYRESRGIKSETEIACVAWTILNRVDAGYGSIYAVITAPYQFAYDDYAPTVSDYNYDLITIANDVIIRWEREHAGETEVGRVLPKDYLWYKGYSGHNWFRNVYGDLSNPWDYSLISPYET